MDPMSFSGPHSLLQDTSEQASAKEHPHAFRAAVEGDSRSPCPALNTLANHGYLPRNGRDIAAHNFLAALCNPETYHLSKPLARFLVYGGYLLMHQFTAPSLSLHELARHGRIEHNASVVHKDTKTGHKFAPSKCDTILLNKLLEEKPLTLDKIARRRVMLEKVSPLDALHQEIARGEWALVLDIFGRESGGEIPPTVMKVWLKENRFPEGWKPTHEQGLVATILKASEIRKKMNEFRQHGIEDPEGPEECLVEVETGEVTGKH